MLKHHKRNTVSPKLPSYSFLPYLKTLHFSPFNQQKLPEYPSQNYRIGSSFFNNPSESTCQIKIQGATFHIHSHYVAPHSGFFRDLLNPLCESTRDTIRLDYHDRSFYRIIDTPFCNANGSRRNGLDLARQNKIDNTPGAYAVKKSNFFQHLKYFETNQFLKEIQKSKHQVTKPVLSIRVPHSKYFSILLRWIYQGPNKQFLYDIKVANRENPDAIFQIIELANFLMLADEFYTILSEFFITNGSLTLARKFHNRLIPLVLFNSFLSKCLWESSDKLAVILWYSRDKVDDERIRLRTENEGAQRIEDYASEGCTCFSKGGKSCIEFTGEMKALVDIYVDFYALDIGYCADLKLLLPYTFDKILKF